MKRIELLLILPICLSYSQSASAYLDPGAGSFLLQMLIAGVIGALFTIKLYWYRFKAFVAKLFGRDVSAENNQSKEETADKN